MARPNSTESPNISPQPNRTVGPKAVEAVVARWEALMQRLIEGHVPEFTEVGVTMAQAKVLYVIMAAGELRMSELAARVGIGLSSASELVERLVEVGYLRRHSDADDRRQVVVTTTPEGIELLERFRELNQRQLRALLDRLDHKELDTVDRSIEILANAINRATSASPRARPARTAAVTIHRENRT